jgi:hypothetical protein
LARAVLDSFAGPMQARFGEQNNLWIYASNITQFHFFDLEFAGPMNVVLLQIIHPAQPQLMDLAPLCGGPVRAHFEIPLRAERIDR